MSSSVCAGAGVRRTMGTDAGISLGHPHERWSPRPRSEVALAMAQPAIHRREDNPTAGES